MCSTPSGWLLKIVLTIIQFVSHHDPWDNVYLSIYTQSFVSSYNCKICNNSFHTELQSDSFSSLKNISAFKIYSHLPISLSFLGLVQPESVDDEYFYLRYTYGLKIKTSEVPEAERSLHQETGWLNVCSSKMSRKWQWKKIF